ncbi:cation efflux system protein [Actinoplanes sp. NBRC 103695]|nr:cation efflux system protein [Actinoplanes sp. NBRC 103695]
MTDHDHEHGWLHGLRHAVTPHSHDSADKVDSALESSRDGLRALWISLVVLGVTAVLQAVIVVFSGSVALLGDTLHNVADALTAVPLGIAFLLGRRAATRAYTYGFGRAEDLAGVVIVLVIVGSAVLAGWTAVERLLDPEPMTHIPWVLAAGGAWLGWSWADPVVGLAITVAILVILKDAAREVYHRLMDRVDPEIVDRIERELRGLEEVRDVSGLKLRWIGHRMHAEASIVVDSGLSLLSAHRIAADAEHQLTHRVPRLSGVTVHVDPDIHAGHEHHVGLSHEHRQHVAGR